MATTSFLFLAALSPFFLAGTVLAAPFEGCATVGADGVVTRIVDTSYVCSCGASFPDSLYQLATLTYATYGEISYTATGSSTGKESIGMTVVDFAGSDSPLSDSDYVQTPDLQMYPATATAVVPFVNIAELEAIGERVVVDRTTLTLIFLGDIYQWTDPQLLALQSSTVRDALLAMADPQIRVVVRDDNSGISEIFTKALSSFSADFASRIGDGYVLDWCEDGDTGLCYGDRGECEGISWDFDSGFETSGTVTCSKASHGGRLWSYTRGYKTRGSIAAVLSLNGAIGYAGLSDVTAARIPQALVKNRAGRVLEANSETVSYALFEFAGLIDERGNADLFDAYSFSAYSIVGFTYFVLRKGVDRDGVARITDEDRSMFNCTTRLNTIAFLEWFYTSEVVEDTAVSLGFTNLPSFIASSILSGMLNENYCMQDDGALRVVKQRDRMRTLTMYSDDLAGAVTATVGLIYREVEPTVEWELGSMQRNLTEITSRLSNDDALAIVSLDGLPTTAENLLPTKVFAAPLFVAGVVPLYHLAPSVTCDNLALSLEQLAKIFLGEITTWAQIRSDLPASTILLVVRTDSCVVNEIVSARLSSISPTFASTFGSKTRVMSASALEALGVTVLAATSQMELEALVRFHRNALAMWERTGEAPATVASIATSTTTQLPISTDSLNACVTTEEAAVTFKSSAYEIESSIYDASLSTSAECWPFSRSYSLLISEELVGPDPCARTAAAFFNVGGEDPKFEASRALLFAQWVFGFSPVDSTEAAGLAPSSASDRALATSALRVSSFCAPPKPRKTAHQFGPDVKNVLIVLVLINYSTTLFCAAWTYRYRRRVIVKLSQPTYLYFLCFGSIVSSTAGVAPLFGHTTLACQLVLWLYATGFIITQATLFVKMQQMKSVIDLSLRMKSNKRGLVRGRLEALGVAAAMMAGEVTILTAWWFLAPLTYKRSCIEEKDGGYWDGVCVDSVGKCRTTMGVEFVSVLCIYHVGCIAAGMFMCYKVRNLPSIMSEGKWVFTSFYSQIQVLITAVPVLAMVRDDSASFTVLKTLVIAMCNLTTMGMIYAPKMILVYTYYDFSRTAVSELVSKTLSDSTQKNEVYEKLRVKRGSLASNSKRRTSASTRSVTPVTLNADPHGKALGVSTSVGNFFAAKDRVSSTKVRSVENQLR